jgi:hypothetical protein
MSGLGDSPLSEQYSSRYNITCHKEVLVADVMSYAPLNVGFTRALTHDKWETRISLLRRLMHISLSDEPATFKWRLTTSKIFLVKSMYADIFKWAYYVSEKIHLANKGTTKN